MFLRGGDGAVAVIEIEVRIRAAGDTVLDCFCGSGGTILAADKLDRQWIGIDSSSAAIKSTLKRLESRPANLLYTPSQFTYYIVETLQTTQAHQIAA
jgi:ubiquinone/menaquinone biosynthesis C-methylase UbiE